MLYAFIAQVSPFFPNGFEAKCYSSSNCQLGTDISDLNALFESEDCGLNISAVLHYQNHSGPTILAFTFH